MFFEPFCKGPCRFSYVFFLTPKLTTFVSVYNPTFVGDWIFVLGVHKEVFYGLTSLEVYLYTIFLTSGLSERFKNTCQKYGVQVHFKGGQTIKDLLMNPKDKDPITNKSGVIYRYKCSEFGCEEEYIGESARTFAERFKEHQKSPSPIHDHCNISGHKADINNFSIIGREDQNLTRAIKEALFIRVNDPSLNRNIGKYHLPHIWDEVLHKTTKLKLNH